MKPFLMPIVFALIALWLTLQANDAAGWRFVPDNDSYLGYTASIVNGDGYRQCPPAGYIMCEQGDWMPTGGPTAYRLPVYPLLLVPLVAAGYADPLPLVRLVHCLLAAALVSLTVGYAQRLRGQWAGAAAGVALLTVPGLTEYARLPLTELPFAVGVMVLVWTLTFKAAK